MSNPQKRKGDQWEREVRDYLAPRFPHVARIPAGASDDLGDLFGIPHFKVDCKNAKRHEHGPWLDSIQAKCRHDELGATIVKRPRRTVDDGFVVMTLDEWALLVEAAFGVGPMGCGR